MPAIITHSFFAEDTLRNIKDRILKNEISSRIDLFYLGARVLTYSFIIRQNPG